MGAVYMVVAAADLSAALVETVQLAVSDLMPVAVAAAPVLQMLHQMETMALTIAGAKVETVEIQDLA